MTMKGKRPLRFGVMCHGTTFPAWQARCLQHLLALDGAEAALLVIDDRPPAPRGRGALWAMYARLVADARSEAMCPVDMARQLAHLPAVRCPVLCKAEWEYLREEDISEIRRHDLDFVLQFAFGVLRGAILGVPRYGVWSFHHDEADRSRGAPPGFWEIYNGDRVTRTFLERRAERPGGGVVLHEGFFKTLDDSYVRNQEAAYFGSADWPARVCKDIRHGTAAYLDGSPSRAPTPVAHGPTSWQAARFVLKVTRNFLATQSDSLFRREHWNVGIVDQPIQAFLAPGARPEARWLPGLARHRFLADPFGRRHGTGTTLLVEEFDYRTQRGRISALESEDGRSFTAPRPVIELPVHMSYPYLFTHRGEVYCVPETHQAREVSLYRAADFPTGWRKIATLLEDFAAVDSTVFQHEGRWWLLCTDRDSGPDTKLYAWYARDLPGPWLPHAANPLKTDVRSSRPAGTPFVHEGQLYRPAQDGSGTYGGAVVVNRVMRLSPTEFDEEVATVVTPDRRGPYPDGLHTLSAAGDLTIIDGQRRSFIPQLFRQALRSKVRKATRRVIAAW